MDGEEAQAVRKLAEYEDDEAGGIMTAEFLAFSRDNNVDSVVQQLRKNASEYSDFAVQYTYVVSPTGQLVGVLRMRDLLLNDSDTRLEQLMIKDPLSVDHHFSVEQLHELFEEHSFVGVPVVDDDGVLVGIARRGDVEEAIGDRNASDFLKTQGIVSEELRTMPLATRSGRRLSWLSINILLNILAASIIAFYQETLTQVIALAVFLPIISDMSGCSGNQAVAVSMRELSLGLVDAKEVMRVWFKEISVGLINGIALGCLIALVAFLWKGNPYLGAVVGIAMMLNTMIAVSLGGNASINHASIEPRPRPRLGSDPHHRHRHVRFLLGTESSEPVVRVVGVRIAELVSEVPAVLALATDHRPLIVSVASVGLSKR